MSQVIKPGNTRSHLVLLQEMRDFGGAALTTGLADDVVLDFLGEQRRLRVAVGRAYTRFVELQQSHADYLALDEADQIAKAHAGVTNFYAEDTVNPYVPASAAGPWIVTLKGAVIYDCGGYGMLGLGHAPEAALAAMNQPHVMANVMTASVNQVDFVERLR